MPRFPEVVHFRAPAGAHEAIDALAKAEGKRFGEVLREAIADRLASHNANENAKAA